MNKNNYLLALNIINRMVKEGALTSEESIIAERKIAEKYCIKDKSLYRPYNLIQNPPRGNMSPDKEE